MRTRRALHLLRALALASACAGAPATAGSAPLPGVAPTTEPLSTAPQPAAPTFDARDGERLSVALARYLAARGWELAWSAAGDFIVERAYLLAATDGDLPQALLRVLRPYRLSAVLHDAPPQRIVNVFQAQSDDDPGTPR